VKRLRVVIVTFEHVVRKRNRMYHMTTTHVRTYAYVPNIVVRCYNPPACGCNGGRVNGLSETMTSARVVIGPRRDVVTVDLHAPGRERARARTPPVFRRRARRKRYDDGRGGGDNTEIRTGRVARGTVRRKRRRS